MAEIMPFRQDPPESTHAAGRFQRRGSLEIDTTGSAPTEQSSASSISLSSLSAMTSDDSLTSDSDADGVDEELSNEQLKAESDSPLSMHQIEEAESSPTSPATAKRLRGRPKKEVLLQSIQMPAKVVKGRSKTGCFTCRRRKKKCDERKPGCLACEKNNVECEGFPRPTVWRSGRHRSDETKEPVITQFSLIQVQNSLPVIINGIDTDIDRQFFDHFGQNLSKVLIIHDEHSNPFNDLLLPMAFEHQGLMHSLMALSGSHFVVTHPEEVFQVRKDYHADIAISMLRQDIAAAGDGEVDGLIRDPVIASTIVQCLICISEGKTAGEHRMHLSAAASLIPRASSRNPAFQKFITEFFLYHDLASTVTSLRRRSSMTPQHAGSALHAFLLSPILDPSCSSAATIGVLDGLYPHISAISILRDTIRARKQQNILPVVSHEAISHALRIDADIRTWQPPQLPGSTRWLAAQLYRQCTWVYLWRTIQASRPSPKISDVVDAGLAFLRALPESDSTQSFMLLPIFLLGCAAFAPRQRPDIEAAFDTLQAYSHLGNIRPAREIVARVWEMMDADDGRSWDWETIMAEQGSDFLIT